RSRYSLSLHDALPISPGGSAGCSCRTRKERFARPAGIASPGFPHGAAASPRSGGRGTIVPVQRQLWLELPPMSADAPRRLLVFLHGAGSTPETFVPVAIAWQLKFPGAIGAIIEGLRPGSLQSGRDWFDARGTATDRAARIDAAAEELAERLRALQRDTSLTPADTVVVGFSQGATMALALARQRPAPAAI